MLSADWASRLIGFADESEAPDALAESEAVLASNAVVDVSVPVLFCDSEASWREVTVDF